MNISRREEAIDQGLRRQMTAWEHNTPLPGIAVCAVLTWGAYQVNHLPYPPFTMADGRHPVSAVLLALLFGIAIGNLLPVARWLKPGVDIVIRRLLPLGIILLGARLDFYNLIRVGLGALLGAMLLIGVVMLSVHFLQARLGVGGKLSMLLGIGTAICGSSAIAAAAPVIEADRKDVALSIALVNILGAVAMLLFPVIGTFLLLSPEIYGAWCGLAIHATPQVIAAGFAHPVDGQTAGEVATIVKLVRISLLGPVIFLIGAVYAHRRRREAAYVGGGIEYRKLVPSFVLLFLVAALLRTSGFLPEVTFHMTDRFLFGAGDRTMDLAQVLGLAAGWLITTAIAGVGLLTEFRALKAGGTRPFALGLACSIVAAFVALLYVSLTS
ncbi:MAG: putative sulfate exporter family transporter [Gemmatimonadetes bacterium]|jgi:uncharacterized integral membrane protein (TIGR00698 family)|nr:putative sulfate exporter family transporter [Gemmatimonadota bacterium]MBT5056228.1 putative sulfate exporter family transporter [Gemmatimonadota bacterium]MBT5146317.1 putative sulfate exporter family transporter [Gemmatimonadota bacterium]MBT5591240.1 putative sulfate exporter family transporter [Gemmatimonadota bacterium]MBT5962305.1 putative sulfate exporter family transporter [Gemmatimonadota bacterium]